MNFKLSWRLALSILKARKNNKKTNKKSDIGITHNLAGTILAITLSLIPVIVVLEVSNGMIEGITRRFLEVGSYHAQVKIYDPKSLVELAELVSAIKNTDSVVNAFWERQGLGLVYSERARSGAMIRGIPYNLNRTDSVFNSLVEFQEGGFDLYHAHDILLGKTIAEELKAHIGDTVKILTVLVAGRTRLAPKITSFTVRGIFTTGYQEMDKNWVYIPFETGVEILPEKFSDQFIAVKFDDPYTNLEGKIDRLKLVVARSAEVYTVKSWFNLEENQYRSFQTMKALLVFIMLLIVFVACFNVSSTMFMIVLEKTQEIGILKSIGASPSSIANAFLMTGFITGVCGCLGGVFSGLLLAVNVNHIIRGMEGLINLCLDSFYSLISWGRYSGGNSQFMLLDPRYYLADIPIKIAVKEIIWIGFFTIFLSTIAAYFPARRAGMIKPLDVIRKV